MSNSNSISSEEPESETESPFVLCRRCGYVRIFFLKDHVLPYEYKNKQIHYCEVSTSFPCLHCEEIVYLDRRVLSVSGKRIPLDQATGKYHVCKERKDIE